MKNFLLFTYIFFSLSFDCYSQNETIKPIEFIQTFETTKSKKEIYLRARLWFYKNFNSYEGFVSVDDYENGIIYCKGILPIYLSKKGENIWQNSLVGGQVRFNLRFYFAENSFKIIFDNLIHEKSSSPVTQTTYGLLTTATNFEEEGKPFYKMLNKNWNLLQEGVKSQVSDLILDLNNTIENETEMIITK